MANTSYLQSSFLGGLWSPSAQGRMHDPAYKTALNEFLNAYPTEEGAWMRRSGFLYAQHTKAGRAAVLRNFDFEFDAPYVMEFTDSCLRLRIGANLLTVSDGDIHVSGITADDPAVVILADTIPANWAAGDTVLFNLLAIPCSAPILANRQFTIGTISGNTFTLKDPISGANIDGSTIAYSNTGLTLDTVSKVFEAVTPYTADDLDALRIVSDDSTVLILHPDFPPRVLTTGILPQPFAISVQEFTDGPYLDTNTTDTTLALSTLTGSGIGTFSSTTGVNDGRGVLTTDVNRLTRFRGAPPIWNAATSYVKGDQVSVLGNDNIYAAQGGLTSVDPTLDDGTHWLVSDAKVNWVCLKVTGRTSETVFTYDLQSDLRDEGIFAQVVGAGNIRFKYDGENQSLPALEGSYPAIDFTQFFAAGQSIQISDGTFDDGSGGDVSGDYTVHSIFNDPDDRRSVMLLTDTDGQAASWAVIDGLADKRTSPHSPKVGLTLGGDELTTPVWRLGFYSDSTGWPSCGTYHEGRLWLSGAASNRVDASQDDDIGAIDDNHFNFAQTAPDGTVGDANAIAATSNATDLNQFHWMRSGEYGLTLGSLAGEWLIRAATTDDPISPSSMQMRRVTNYGCANIEPQLCLRSLVFVQRQQRRVMDFANYPWGEAAGWYADNLEHFASTLTCGGIEEIRYQQTPAWNLWARRNDGALVGTAFRHAAYGKESFNGWHRHEHGDGRIFESIAVSSTPTESGIGETLYAVTNQTGADDADHNVRWVEMLSPEFDDCTDDCAAFFIDGAAVPANCSVLTGGTPPTGIRLYGLWHLNGKSVAAFIGGLDLGDFTVSNGYIDVPFGGTFTWTYFQTLGSCTLTGTSTNTVTVSHAASPFTGSLEGFVAAGSPVVYDTIGAVGGQFYTDPDVPYIVGIQTDTDDNGGMQVFNRNTAHGDEAGESVFADIFGAGPAHVINSLFASRMHPNGNFYGTVGVSGASNRGGCACIRISDRTLLGIFGDVPGSGFGSDATHFAAMFGMCAVVRGTSNYLVTVGETGAGHINEIAVWNATGVVVYIGKTDLSDDVGIACEGLRGRGDFYVIGHPFYAGNSLTNLTLYEGWAPSATLRTIVSLAPSDIDPTWTHTAGVGGLAFDAADGNLIFFVETLDSVTHPVYLVKVNRLTGAVMWTSVVPSAPLGECDLTLCNLNGTLQIFDDGSNHSVITFDLSDGSQTTQAWNAGIAVTSQFYDCSTASIFTIASYGQSTGPIPNLLGDYFANNASLSHRVLEIFSGDTVFQDGDTVVTTYDFYGGLGFTYTSRGQLLRPDFGTDAGAQAGPAFAKIRRPHWYGISMVRSRGASIGTDFITMRPIPLQTAGGNDIAAPTLFSGIVTTTIDADYGFEGQIAWQITRPWPCIITAISGFGAAQDK